MEWSFFHQNQSSIMFTTLFESYKRISFRHKNSKFLYYLENYTALLIPAYFYQIQLKRKLKDTKGLDMQYVCQRVDYYNKLSGEPKPLADSIKLSQLRLKKKQKVYFFDTRIITRYFNQNLRMDVCFGDVTHVPDRPSIVKSRPIRGENANAVVLKLEKIRHFLFIKDQHAYQDKENKLIGRGKINQPHRARFMEMYFNHPLCDVGGVSSRAKYPQWIRPRLTLEEHLNYKFILCLEGYDVASNLKWVMSSNSLAVMPEPTYETWFMEGTLIPDYHYVAIKRDYSDLEEKLRYYMEHEDEALAIIEHAHQYIAQFKNRRQEKLISLLVMKKYFEQTAQSI